MPNIPFKSNLFILFYVFMYECAQNVCLLPEKDRRGGWITWDLSYHMSAENWFNPLQGQWGISLGQNRNILSFFYVTPSFPSPLKIKYPIICLYLIVLGFYRVTEFKRVNFSLYIEKVFY